MTQIQQTGTLVDQLRSAPTASVETSAHVLGVSRAYAYALARSGELPTIKVGNRIRVPSKHLLKLIGED
ncbi:helix-turn-helix domain-containing protein [Gordonia sp. NPDC003504]